MQDFKRKVQKRNRIRRRNHPRFKIKAGKQQGGISILSQSTSKKEKTSEHLWKQLTLRFQDPEAHPFVIWMRVTQNIVFGIFACWLVTGLIWVTPQFFQQSLRSVYHSELDLLQPLQLKSIGNLSAETEIIDMDQHALMHYLNQHPMVKGAEVRSLYPDQVFLNLTEHKPVAYLKHQDGYYLLNEDQEVLRKDSSRVLEGLPLLSGIPVEQVFLGKKVRSFELFQGMEFVRQVKKTKVPIDQMVEIDLSDAFNIKVTTKEGSMIHFGEGEYEESLMRYKAWFPKLLEQHPDLQWVDLSYSQMALLQLGKP